MGPNSPMVVHVDPLGTFAFSEGEDRDEAVLGSHSLFKGTCFPKQPCLNIVARTCYSYGDKKVSMTSAPVVDAAPSILTP